jgi:glyoxylase-like metal-dependent hydrolase (beta-lactamase superfamily II)
MISDQIQLACIVSVPFEENTYVARLKGRNDCVVVDPGLEPGKILEHLDSENIDPAAILLTHGHADHIAGNAALKQRWPDCPLVIGAGDAPKLSDADLNLSGPYGLPFVSPPADLLLRDGDAYEAAGFSFRVAEIPGHSVGHVVFIWDESPPVIVFGGDVLFAGSIGRTDFPDGSFEQLAEGIRKHLYSLPDDTVVLPGHGPPTTVGREKRTNPFVGQ